LQGDALNGHLGSWGFSLDEGTLINASLMRCKGFTALLAAALENHIEIVERLSAVCTDARGENSITIDILHCVQLQRADILVIVEILLKAGADVHVLSGNEHWTTIQAANFKGHEKVVEVLRDAIYAPK
jgi:hypothetical protein